MNILQHKMQRVGEQAKSNIPRPIFIQQYEKIGKKSQQQW